jgi:hypothetical protein
VFKKLYLLLVIFSFLFVSQADAATWYMFNKIYTDKIVNYFDYETVVKRPDSVIIWVKYVNDQSSPDSDASYMTAQKYTYECSKRTYIITATSTYDKDGSFIRSYPPMNKPNDVTPGSLGEDFLKTVCASDFPHKTDDNLYFKIKDNDIIKFSKTYFDWVHAKENDPAPK